MIIRCDNCSVSLQLDESKIPGGNFTVRCPRCQNMLRVQKDASGKGLSTVQQLQANQAAPASAGDSTDFAAKESGFQINAALKSLMAALQSDKVSPGGTDDSADKPRRVLLCLGANVQEAAKQLAAVGYKVYIAQTPAQANERLRDGKTEILIFSPDFAPELGGAAVLQQRANAMYSSERRRLYLISLEDGGPTMNAQAAFLRNLNLIVGTGDLAQLPMILDRALHDHNELYNYFNRSMDLSPI
jgi:predicted Zn finger-like uncharacterized protein